MHFTDENLNLFMSLFKGRDDVFAVRWENDGKSGYIPAYDLNWEEFKAHKSNGGTLKDFRNKKYSALTRYRIQNHLHGKETIGIYPLLADNASWFIVADFDEALSSKMTWIEECRAFIQKCTEFKLSAYLERSRSGKGGHVWIFFEKHFPAIKSRKIAFHLLEQAGIISLDGKNANYDRLFPNQDFHSGKGIGNLIALPFQKLPFEKQNSCFIDPETQQAYSHQWEFLHTMNRIPVALLDEIHQRISNSPYTVSSESRDDHSIAGVITIRLSNNIELERKHISIELLTFLKGSLNFVNSAYIVKKKLGKSTYGTEMYFKVLTESEDRLFMPRGFIGKLLRHCREHNIQYNLEDCRRKLTEVRFNFRASLFEHQELALSAAEKKDLGVIVAPPGSGKTVIGLAIAARHRQPTLIIVHRKQLFDQWIQRIQSFLGIAEAHIGKITDGKCKVGTHITVAMIQSLATRTPDSQLFSSFGTIIVDECHHLPAKTFGQVVNQLSSYYLYGLTATPIRKNNDEKLIFIHIGDVIHEIKSKAQADQNLSVIIRETELFLPFDYKTDHLETLYKTLIHDTRRNQQIADDVHAEVATGNRVLVLTERKDHIIALHQFLKNSCEVVMVSGDDSISAQKARMIMVAEGHFQVLITTGQYMGEGTDIRNIDCLILAFPFSFEGKLIQYIGRVQRSESIPLIYDYRDRQVPFLENQFRQRNKYYRKLLKSGSLNKNDQLLLIFDKDRVRINATDTDLPISCLDIETPIERFNDGVVWLVSVLGYNEDTGVLMTKILNYNAGKETGISSQVKLQFLVIDKIRFRTINTNYLLRSVQLSKTHVSTRTTQLVPAFIPPDALDNCNFLQVDQILKRTMKVPFENLQFGQAFVSFSVFIDELKEKLSFEIENPDVRPEFEVVKSYFSRVLKKKLIVVHLEIRYNEEKVLSALAKSDDINLINSRIIDSVRFEFVKREVMCYTGKSETSLHTIDKLPGHNEKLINLFKSDQQLVDDILAIKKSKHYHQLKFLSSQHLSSILKLRFILQPFSFVFLLSGESKYHLVWETLNSQEATYVWHFEKNTEALRVGLNLVDAVLLDIKMTGKLDYLKKDHENFSRIMHDYSDVKSGFVYWKGALEATLI